MEEVKGDTEKRALWWEYSTNKTSMLYKEKLKHAEPQF